MDATISVCVCACVYVCTPSTSTTPHLSGQSEKIKNTTTFFSAVNSPMSVYSFFFMWIFQECMMKSIHQTCVFVLLLLFYRNMVVTKRTEQLCCIPVSLLGMHSKGTESQELKVQHLIFIAAKTRAEHNILVHTYILHTRAASLGKQYLCKN